MRIRNEMTLAELLALPLMVGVSTAARALGLGYFVTTWKVILPQALYNVIPGILNNLTAIFKESSLAYVISLHELTFAALQVMNFEMRRPVQVLVLLAAIYVCCGFALSQTASWLEVRVARKRERDSGLIQPNAQLAQA